MLEQINEVISGMIVPLMLALCGGFFSFRLNFFHILKPFTVLKGLRSSNYLSSTLKDLSDATFHSCPAVSSKELLSLALL